MSVYLMAVEWNLALPWVIFQVAAGLGFVIFVHELGHFLVAKACGVQCDKFYIGFDIGGCKIWSRQWGETEYGIGILPLGGYVKMLGQDDNPSNIAEESEKSRIRDTNTSGNGTAEDSFTLDPRSYLAKSVPQRMAIISAGVIMNLIFAVVFATIAYSMGVKYLPAIVSDIEPGSPAWRSDVRPGDDIVRIGDNTKPRFRDLQSSVAFGDLANGVPLQIKRENRDELLSLTLRPEHGQGLVPTIGVLSPKTLTIGLIWPGSSAAQTEPALKEGDLIVSIDGVTLHRGDDLSRIRVQRVSEPWKITVRRKRPTEGATDEITAIVAPAPLKRLGLVMEMTPIAAIKEGSPAEKSGIAIGDLLVQINGKPIGDPMTLAARIQKLASAGGEVTLTIARPKKGSDQTAELTKKLILNPPRSPELTRSADGLVSIPGLGVAFHVTSRIASVMPDSPAAQAGIHAGDHIEACSFMLGDAEPSEETAKEIESLTAGKAYTFDSEVRSWPQFMNVLQAIVPGMKIKVTVRSDDVPRDVELMPVASEEWAFPNRGLVMKPLLNTRQAESLGEAFNFGLDETKGSVLMVYRFLQKIGHQISVKALGGPITIAQTAGLSAFQGFASLLIFLTMLSANLAVINFLPIPLLDGGHMIFLTWEGVFRKPMSERIMIAFHMLGFAFIIGLMLFVIGLDVGRLLGLT